MKIYDFSFIEFNNQLYGGQAGQKMGFNWNNEKWFLKFPKSTKSMEQVRISYTTSPLSEYIGSHVYKLIGLDVHDTQLGIYDDKLVVACRDFKQEDENLFDFHAIKNLYSLTDTFEINYLSESGGLQSLEELYDVFKSNQIFKTLPTLRQHFWNMFVVDALIGNHDRNNGNWGILVNSHTSAIRLAPIYDNGAALSNKLDENKMLSLLDDEDRFKQSIYENRISFFSFKDKIINPLKYIETKENPECNEAILRIFPRLDLVKIQEMINQIPEVYITKDNKEIPVISQVQKDFYCKVLAYRYHKVFLPVFTELNNAN